MGATVIDDVTKLKVSSQPRSGAPDGNIYFDAAHGVLEIIVDTELAQVDLGAGLVNNPLTLDAKPTLRALYQLETQTRKDDETARQFSPFLKGRFKLGRAYDFVFGRTAGDDRGRIAGSGWREFGGAQGEQLNRIYFNVSTLPSILSTSQVKYQLQADGAVADFSRLGNVDEAIQVFGTTANGDTGAGNFDSTTYLALTVRTYGQRHARVVLSDFGINELEGYGTLAALGESPHPTTGVYAIADVYGGAQISPWTGISFDVLSTPETKSGFNEADGDFSLIIRNAENASLDQIIAWCDALSAEDTDSAATGTWNGLQRQQLYTFNASGIPEFIQGLYVENLPASDQQRLRIFDDAGAAKTFPFVPEVRVSIPPVAQNTTSGWYHCFIKDGAGSADYNTENAVTMQDTTGSAIKGAIGPAAQVSFGVDYDWITLAGLTPGQDFDLIFTIGSDGEFEERTIEIPVTRQTLIPASIDTVAENNI